MERAPDAGGLRGPVAASIALHASAVVLLLVVGRGTVPTPPPLYRVNIVAAPPGPRAAGVVSPTAPAPAETPAPPPPRAEAPVEQVAPVPAPVQRPPARRPPPQSTPNQATTAPAKPSTPAPRAGGGPVGGRGTDVATVRTEGIEFPFPGYLNNIVRQIALRFKPDNPSAPLRSEVMFLIHRDGSVSNVRFVTRSGVYAFDLEAQGAVEAAASAGAFGPLPAGFPDDVLPVIFSFDPRILR